jgi:hypothetical protein
MVLGCVCARARVRVRVCDSITLAASRKIANEVTTLCTQQQGKQKHNKPRQTLTSAVY